jgi:hypothetical protein
VVGGAVASLTGDKFENGAVTGAFSYAFNDLLHVGRDDYFNKAMAYLKQDPGMTKVIGDLENSSTAYTVVMNSKDQNHFDHSTDTIQRDPETASERLRAAEDHMR